MHAAQVEYAHKLVEAAVRVSDKRERQMHALAMRHRPKTHVVGRYYTVPHFKNAAARRKAQEAITARGVNREDMSPEEWGQFLIPFVDRVQVYRGTPNQCAREFYDWAQRQREKEKADGEGNDTGAEV